MPLVALLGMPAVVIPFGMSDEGLPIGVQLIAAPWREELCLRAARTLEMTGVAIANPPRGPH